MSDALLDLLVADARPRLEQALTKAYECAETELPVIAKLLEALGIEAEAHSSPPPGDQKRGLRMLRQLTEAPLMDVAILFIRAIADEVSGDRWDVTEANVDRVLRKLDPSSVSPRVGLEPPTVRLVLLAMRAHLLELGKVAHDLRIEIDERTIELRPPELQLPVRPPVQPARTVPATLTPARGVRRTGQQPVMAPLAESKDH